MWSAPPEEVDEAGEGGAPGRVGGLAAEGQGRSVRHLALLVLQHHTKADTGAEGRTSVWVPM